ncbi:ABC transporter ATP-binding protein [Corticibacterium sp. UT-5YL-CI-8]|nr:ABC transporter ATP-binding protein [Tianweitania sp. UT-5YL-CI-8]
MIDVRNINAFYGGSHVLHDIDINIPTRARVAVIGRNGAGKSTLLKSIMNAGPRTEGDIRWEGASISRLPAYKRARLGIQLVPEDRRIYQHLTVVENILMSSSATVTGRTPLDISEMVARFPMIGPILERRGGQISGGQQQMVAIARAIACRPRALLLDEPTEGLAPAIVEKLADDVRAVAEREDMALLLCEQNIWFAKKTTDRVYVMDAGRIAFSGSWAEFDAQPEIKQRHLAV